MTTQATPSLVLPGLPAQNTFERLFQSFVPSASAFFPTAYLMLERGSARLGRVKNTYQEIQKEKDQNE